MIGYRSRNDLLGHGVVLLLYRYVHRRFDRDAMLQLECHSAMRENAQVRLIPIQCNPQTNASAIIDQPLRIVRLLRVPLQYL